MCGLDAAHGQSSSQALGRLNWGHDCHPVPDQLYRLFVAVLGLGSILAAEILAQASAYTGRSDAERDPKPLKTIVSTPG
ncbi:hypothetical protein [Sodalinema sp.]|uniref:hypothetical protein n=1 Tax=Sodalinema sp. TaxID=3080550 RepID=UPI00396F46A6